MVSVGLRDSSGLQYRYKRLNLGEIRLLKLERGNRYSALKGSLHHTSLKIAETYTALSYTWQFDNFGARPSISQAIKGNVPSGTFLASASDHIVSRSREVFHKRCHLQTPQGSISITPSLDSALRSLRKPRGPKEDTRLSDFALWADAICINQEDNEEKSIQVQLMAQIYHGAGGVIAYLGEEADNSSLAINTLGMISCCDRANPPLSMLPPDAIAWQAVRAFFLRPWCTRKWIIQEAVVAKEIKILCGNFLLHWEMLPRAILNIEAMYKKVGAMIWLYGTSTGESPSKEVEDISRSTLLITLLDSVRKEYQEGKRRSLESLLTLFKLSEASDEKDHLFALLGISRDAHAELLRPDYNANFESIVRRYGSYFVTTNSVARVLYRAGLGSQPDRLPSWLPDWTSDPMSKRITLKCSIAAHLYNAAADRGFHGQYVVSKDELLLTGCRVDKVTRLGRCLQATGDTLKNCEGLASSALRGLQDADLMTCDILSYPTGEDIQEAKWRTLIVNSDGEGSEALQSLSPALPAMKELLEQGHQAREFDADIRRMLDPRRPFLGHAMTSIAFRKFCVTRDGYFGLLPMSAELGDQIHIIYGCVVPFVLRPSGTREGAYRLVGECYVHGIMKGEALASGRFREEELRVH